MSAPAATPGLDRSSSQPPLETLRSRYVMAGHTRTHYVETGLNGPAVVLCHGGGPGASGEAGFGRIMPALAPHFQVYALDGVGGYGETDPHVAASEGAQSRVDHLEAFLDTLCLDQVLLAGNSQGAWVVAKYALEHPDRVRKLMLLGSNTIAQAMGIDTPTTEAGRALRAYDGTPESMRRVLEGLIWNKRLITDELVALRTADANRPGAAEARAVFQQGQQRLTRDANLRLKFEMTHTLPRLTIPTLFVWGEDDAFAPVGLAHQLAQRLPQIPFRYVPQAGHQVQTDQPDLLAEMMIEFFSA